MYDGIIVTGGIEQRNKHRPERLLIFSTVPAITRNLIWAAGELAKECVVVTHKQDAPCFRMPHVRKVILVSQDAVESGNEDVLETLEQAASDEPLLLVPGGTRSTRLVSRNLDRLAKTFLVYPVANPETFEQLHDKGRFAGLLETFDLPAPRSVIIRNIGELEPCSVEFPVVAKPVVSEGNKPFEPIPSLQLLQQHCASQPPTDAAPVLIQEYIPGRDIDLSLLAVNGRILAWTVQQMQPNAVMKFIEHDEVLKLGSALVEAANYTGVMHLDMRIDDRDKRVKFIEANPRFWGTHCYSTWMGVDFLSHGAAAARGKGAAFQPVTGSCPYLGITRRSLPHILLGGRAAPAHLTDRQERSWRFHHRPNNAALRQWISFHQSRTIRIVRLVRGALARACGVRDKPARASQRPIGQ